MKHTFKDIAQQITNVYLLDEVYNKARDQSEPHAKRQKSPEYIYMFSFCIIVIVEFITFSRQSNNLGFCYLRVICVCTCYLHSVHVLCF